MTLDLHRDNFMNSTWQG